jgi:hypothetical protein
MIHRTVHRSDPKKRRPTRMKKLLVATLGLGLALGSISFSFAQDTTATTKKAKKGKKKKADKTETTK